MGNNLGPKVI